MRRTDSREDEETAAARRMAHLTAICQRCGDAGGGSTTPAFTIARARPASRHRKKTMEAINGW